MELAINDHNSTFSKFNLKEFLEMKQASKKVVITGALMAALGASQSFATANDFNDGFHFGGSVGKSFVSIKPRGKTLGIVDAVQAVNGPDETWRISYKNRPTYGLFSGWKNGDLRYELGWNYSNAKFKTLEDMNESGAGGPEEIIGFVSGQTKYHNVGITAFKDFDDMHGFVPYVGVGAGVARFKTVLRQSDAVFPNFGSIKNTKPTAQLVAGARLPITDGFQLAADYKYFSSIGKVGAIGKRFANHSLNLSFLFQPSFLG